ncbi:MAG: VWA domain-containing protein [Actinobacteria bacterium]|nr:VWA domain-containing protein [Actinomycetota bacterium]
MTFLAPHWLGLLAVIAVLASAYVVLQGRRRHYAVRFTNLDLLASVAPRRPGWRRHLPAAAMGLAAVALAVGLARPAREIRVAEEAATLMLVVDVSVSMDATDVAPTRLAAAIEAGRAFVHGLPDGLLVGLVSFDRGTRVMSPTRDHEAVQVALHRLTTGPGTAAGEAIYAALDAIASVAGGPPPRGKAAGEQTAAIVLLSDGVTTVGRPVELAAAAAADQRVPVTTIAFGTAGGTVMVQGEPIPVPADPLTMAAVAETTGGRFFEAFSAGELRSVYSDIGSRVGFRTERREIGMTFVAVGAGLLLLALAASLFWSGRML